MRKRVFTRAAQDPERLDALLSARLLIPPADAAGLVARGAVHIDGARVIAAERVPVGAKIVAFLDPVAQAAKLELAVVRADEMFAVVDKPPGVPVQAERAASEHALDAQVRRRFGRQVRLVNRLDKEASGLVLFTLQPEARLPLQAALDADLIERRYVAIVSGELRGEGTIRLRIGRHASDQRLRAAFPEQATAGQAACTRYRALASVEGRSAVEVTLETGRTHQIRVHMAAIGHPLVGDVVYGGPPHERLCLHAFRLAFPHPRTRQPIEVESKLPSDFAALVPGLTRRFA
jgi:23S rRNA pseudouridine1911/1915/1917 synthase